LILALWSNMTISNNALSTVSNITIPESISFEMVDGLMILKVPNEEGYDNYLFDTGSEQIIIDDNVTQGSFQVVSVDHTLEANKITIDRLVLGSTSLSDINAWALNLGFLEQQIKVDLKGVIGAQLLQDHSVMIDHEYNTITFVEHSYNKCAIDKQYNVISLDFVQEKNGLPIIELTIGEHELRLGFDTGANVCVFDTKFTERLAAYSDLSDSNTALRDLKIQNCELKNVPYLIKSFDEINADRSQKIDGLISADALSTKKIFIDSKRKKIFLLWDKSAA